MSVYRPAKGSPVTWVYQDGRIARRTKVGDTSDVKEWTIDRMIARYGDPRPALLSRPDLAAGTAMTVEQLVRDPLGMTFFRFPLDPTKGALPGAIRRAAETANRYGIGVPEDQALAFQQAMDIAATLCPQGESSPFLREFAPDATGWSTDRANPTRINVPNPPFGLHGYPFGGTTYWLYNEWQQGPQAPPEPSAPLPPPSPIGISSPEQRAAELHAWVGQKWEAAGPLLRPIIAEAVVMFRKAVGK